MSSEELPELTENQLKFVQGIQAGKSASDAYREAYSCENMQENTLWANASRLRTHSKVSAWLKAIKREQIKAANYTLQDHIRELTEAQQLAEEKGQIGPMVAAIEKKGRALGLYIEKHEDMSKIDDTGLLQAINTLLGPEAARNAAKMLGLEDETEH